MHHGCYKRCPKVREQLRKAREEAREETDDEGSSSESNLSEVAGPSGGHQKSKNEISKRSKQSSRYPSGVASPTKTVESPRRSQHTLARESPVRSPNASHRFDPEGRSHRRSKESHRSKGFPSGPVGPGKSADPSRGFDPERGSNRRSHESERIKREKSQRPAERKKTGTSSKTLRKEQRDPDEYRSGTSSRSNTEERIANYVRGLKRGAVGKSRGKIREAGDDEQSEDNSQNWSNNAYDQCAPNCRGRNERMRRTKNDEQQEEYDEYLLYKNLPYFEDLCTCCYKCFANQLWKDPFVKSTAASIAVFTLGLKLCWELDGWTVS